MLFSLSSEYSSYAIGIPTITGAFTIFVYPLINAFAPGEKADKARIRQFPIEAIKFAYGPEAEQRIIEEYSLLQEEQRKNRLFETLTEQSEVEIDPKMFLSCYQPSEGESDEESLIVIVKKLCETN